MRYSLREKRFVDTTYQETLTGRSYFMNQWKDKALWAVFLPLLITVVTLIAIPLLVWHFVRYMFDGFRMMPKLLILIVVLLMTGLAIAGPAREKHRGWPNKGISEPGVPNHYAGPRPLRHP